MTKDLILNDISPYENRNHANLNEYYLVLKDDPIEYLPNTNDINIFIGSNNCGKSRFMRKLLVKSNFTFIKNYDKFSSGLVDYKKKISQFNEQMPRIYNSRNLSYHNKDNYNKIIEAVSKNLESEFEITTIENIANKNDEIVLNSKILENTILDYGKLNFDHSIYLSKNYFSNNFPNIKAPSKIFIPTLRTAHSILDHSNKKIEEDFYLTTIKKNYNLDISDLKIFTGLDLYKQILDARNSKKEKRKRFEEFEKFISKNFFNNKSIDIVAEYNFDKNKAGNNSDNNIILHIEGEKDKALFELGDGIQALIVLLFPIFMASEESFIFIDEPEINLHPGMQRLFLNQICNNEDLKAKNLKYFISTHSNHLLDLSIHKENVSIYGFKTKENLNIDSNNDTKFEIRNINSGDNTILKELGVNNSSVFLANCSIWVEGVSDRNYLKAFLYAYIKDENNNAILLKEDIDFAFFEYAGSNIKHYIFEEIDFELQNDIKKNINALALNNKIFLVADSDNVRRGTKKFERLEELEINSNIQTHIIKQIREIENILTDEIWLKAAPFYCDTKLYSNNKNEINLKIEEALKVIKPKKYNDKYIGVFFEDLRINVGKINTRYIINKSIYKEKGTLNNKSIFSENILNLNLPWSIYKKSKEIKELTEKIYKFIIENKS